MSPLEPVSRIRIATTFHRRASRNLAVLAPVRILRPAREPEADDSHLGARQITLDEYRPEVARPAAIRGKAEELHAPGIHPVAQEGAPGPFLMRFRIHQNAHDFAGCNLPHDFTVHPGDRCKLARPVGEVVRPSEPRGFMRFPLGGQAVAEPCGVLPYSFLRHGSSFRKRLAIPA